MGGAVVQKILHLHPDKIKAAVLMASLPPNGMLKDLFRLFFTNFREVVQMSLCKRTRASANFAAKVFFSK